MSLLIDMFFIIQNIDNIDTYRTSIKIGTNQMKEIDIILFKKVIIYHI